MKKPPRRRKSFAAKRAYLTKGERAAMYQAQSGLCGCGCGEPLGDDFIAEHVHELVSLGNAEKPDSLWTKACADRKTFGVRGDVQTVAKIKRLAEDRTQHGKRNKSGGSRIPKREGWWKKFSKKFDGSVVRK